MANNCQIQTPHKYVIQILDYAGYKEDIFGKKVLENSCGEGNILLEIVKRYIKDARASKRNNDEIIVGLENDIVAFDVDPKKIDICKKRLDDLAVKERVPHVKWNVKQRNYLKTGKGEYDYIIGNPPYITYHDIDVKERRFLKEHYYSCKNGRFDYSYAFVEKAIKDLKVGGELVYILPYSVLKNKFADHIRKMMLPCITDIYDYDGERVFPNALLSPVILVLEKGTKAKCVCYHQHCLGKKTRISKQRLQNKWILSNKLIMGSLRFGDFFDVFNSVATLNNATYIIDEYEMDESHYRIGDKFIEKQIAYPAISPKCAKKKVKDKEYKPLIIFPYCVEAERVDHFSTEEFEEKYPLAADYLKDKKKKSFGKTDGNLWFEYGRSQAIAKVFGEKIVMPMVVSQNATYYLADKLEIPYAGYFIKRKSDVGLSLEVAKKVLESNEFYLYAKENGTPTTPSSYRISVNDVKEYRFYNNIL